MPGFSDIIRYKALKGLQRPRRSPLERALPWSTIARAVDRRYRVTAQPAARAASGAFATKP